MLLGILADTHDEVARTRAAIALLRGAGAAALVHCGDLASPAIVGLLGGLPSWFVLGNHDADRLPDLERAARAAGVGCLGWGGVVDVGGRRVGVVHGHLRADLRRVLAEAPDFLLSGHSHIPAAWDDGPTRRINPGALHRADEFTVALLDLRTGAVRFLPIFEGPTHG